MARKSKPKAAFVLSGGAGPGSIQVGMLRALCTDVELIEELPIDVRARACPAQTLHGVELPTPVRHSPPYEEVTQ